MRTHSILRGFQYALPIILGYLPVGFAFGVLAVQAGMTPVTVGLMSYFVYAGSAQLIAAGLLAAGVGSGGIIITTFTVNLRHLLMSAAVTPYLKHWSKPLQAWFCFELTDETFAANIGRFASRGSADKGETIGMNGCAHMGWVAGSLAGSLFTFDIAQIRLYGLDFALPAMFIALLTPHFRIPRRALAVCFGASLSLIFALLGAGQWNVMLATVCGATLAAFLPRGCS
jgi:4-azaleucine resistance transporter AzlC